MDEDLQSLTAEAAQIDAQLIPPTPEEQAAAAAQVAAPNEAAELSALIQIVSGLFAPMFPSLREIYTTQACDALAAAAVPVMAKRGWSVSGLLGKYAEEVALLAVAAPMALATYQGIHADMAKAAKAQKDSDKEPQAPGIELNTPSAADGPELAPRA